MSATTITTMARRLTRDEWFQGAAWYAAAHEEAKYVAASAYLAKRAASLDEARGAAVIAALSPRLPWRANVRAARNVAETGDCSGVFGVNRAKAKAALVAEEPLTVLGGPKVRAFARCILEPLGEHGAVVLDVWALRLALDLGRDGKVPSVTVKQYEALAAQFRAAAKEIGTLPHVLQAALWVHLRGDGQ